jgi:hypothetical protein
MNSAAPAVRPQFLLLVSTLAFTLVGAAPRAHAGTSGDSSQAATATAPAAAAPEAQTPAAATAPDLSGTWILDRKTSDDLSKLRPQGTESRGGGGRGMRGGWGGGGGGGAEGGFGGGRVFGGGRGGMRRGGPEGGAPEGGDRQPGGGRRWMNPQPEKLTLYQHGQRLEFFDGAQTVRVLSWSAEPDTGMVAAAKWAQNRLVTEGASPRSGSRAETFELQQDGKVLEVRLTVKRDGEEPRELVSHYTKYEGN